MLCFPGRLFALASLGVIVLLPLHAEMRVAQPEALRAVVKKVQPDYNPIAKQMRVQGEVEVEARVSDAGDVVDVKVLSGMFQLANSLSIDATGLSTGLSAAASTAIFIGSVLDRCPKRGGPAWDSRPGRLG